MRRKLGKKPARPAPFPLALGHYLTAGNLPVVPAVFPNPALLTRLSGWGMDGNDQWGDCAWAGAAHETMLFKAAAGFPPPLFSTAAVLSDYAACTGFAYTDATDEGTDVQEMAAYRQRTGVIDGGGVRHKIDAYAALRAGDVDQLAQTTFLLGSVGVGVQLPSSAEDQFDHAEVWDVVRGDEIDGGHYIPCVGRNSNGNFLFVSWGRLQAATPRWVQTYCDEAYAYLTHEYLSAQNLSPEGFDYAGLMEDFAAVTA